MAEVFISIKRCGVLRRRYRAYIQIPGPRGLLTAHFDMSGSREAVTRAAIERGRQLAESIGAA